MTVPKDTAGRPPCVIDGCESPVKSRGWCARHHSRFLRWGDPLVLRRPAPNVNPPTVCTIEGCERKHVARGMCRMHYTRVNRGQPIGNHSALRNPDAICSVDDCDRRARAFGFCTLHAQRYRVHGDPLALAWGSLPDETETSLYRLWSDEGDLLYIGVTVDVPRRFRQHSKCQPWWDQVAHYGVEIFPTRSAAFAAEMVAARSEAPRHNQLLRPTG